MILSASKYISNFPHGLMFHRLHREDSLPSGQGSITDKEFEDILNYVGIENILSSDEWLCKLENNNLNRKDLCVTFDDGLKCQYEICLPILEKYNIKAFWYIYSSVFEGRVEKIEVYSHFITMLFANGYNFFDLFFFKCKERGISIKNGYLYKKFYTNCKLRFPVYSVDDIRYRFIRDKVLDTDTYENIMDELMEEKGISVVNILNKLWMNNSDLKLLCEKGHHIGLHSYNHPTVISSLPFDEQYNQYNRNYRHIYEICNREIYSMAHPCGDYSNSILKILKDLGIKCGFRSDLLPPDGGKINQNQFEIAREDSANILKLMKKHS